MVANPIKDILYEKEKTYHMVANPIWEIKELTTW